MTRFVGVADRHQIALLPHRLDDYVSDDNPVRIVDVFVDELDLAGLGFCWCDAGRDGQARLSSRDTAEALPLRLPQPSRLQPLDLLRKSGELFS
uniref:Transposase IS4 family protein n=1 Tax=Methylobacterium oryzae CBMB20 TaxID=693986 RepID=A0A088B376_9HYPH|nr:Transposase IS4 family protein [Methylobacterium oryzae CBMB20]